MPGLVADAVNYPALDLPVVLVVIDLLGALGTLGGNNLIRPRMEDSDSHPVLGELRVPDVQDVPRMGDDPVH